jgi:hypothetical protein
MADVDAGGTARELQRAAAAGGDGFHGRSRAGADVLTLRPAAAAMAQLHAGAPRPALPDPA